MPCLLRQSHMGTEWEGWDGSQCSFYMWQFPEGTFEASLYLELLKYKMYYR